MKDIETIGVAGAGTMGAGIAIVCARAGFRTRVFDTSAQALDRARGQTESFLANSVKRGRLAADKLPEIMGQWHGTSNVADLADCDLVIEAVLESLAVKHELLAKLDSVCAPHTIFASNTSSCSVTDLMAVTRRHDRVVGLHFFNPVPAMKLVEIVRTLATDEAVVTDLQDVVRRVGKEPILAEDRSGFIVNRLLVPYLLDTTLYISEIMFDEYREKRFAAPALLRRMVAAGRLGRKSGRGFYDHADVAKR